MASIYKRKDKDGKLTGWRAVIRIKGYPSACKTCERKQEAEDWAQETEQKIKSNQFNYNSYKQQHTYQELVERHKLDGVFEHHRSFEKIKSQFEYWLKRLGRYALVHITPEIISKERQILVETPTPKGTKRSPATINRYMAVLASTFTYAVKNLRWLSKNPCANLLKVKENTGRDRILQEAEFSRLLEACRESKSPYLYCIVLIALTTGARRGEILGLTWADIDFDQKIAHFRETKNGRPRSVALSDPVIDEFKQIFERSNRNKSLVFASKTTFGTIDIKKAWQEALKRANIINYRFHDTRHTFCTLAARQGASNLELATAMGHRTLQMLQRYTHLDVEVTKKFSKNISEQILQGVPA